MLNKKILVNADTVEIDENFDTITIVRERLMFTQLLGQESALRNVRENLLEINGNAVVRGVRAHVGLWRSRRKCESFD